MYLYLFFGLVLGSFLYSYSFVRVLVSGKCSISDFTDSSGKCRVSVRYGDRPKITQISVGGAQFLVNRKTAQTPRSETDLGKRPTQKQDQYTPRDPK